MRRRQISQQNNASEVLAGASRPREEVRPLVHSPVAAPPRKRGRPKKVGVTAPYVKGNPV